MIFRKQVNMKGEETTTPISAEEEAALRAAEALAPPPPKRLSLNDLADLLVEKGVLKQSDVDGKKK